MLEGWRPPYDAAAVERLEAMGAVVIGKANLDEFGMGSTTESSAYGPTSNPRDGSRVPGGSSGGSAAAVASGLCAAALGSDTGGSVRQPASHCGVVGVKPTYGLVSRWGLVAYASSLDTVGPLAGSVECAARVLAATAGRDAGRDATSARSPAGWGGDDDGEGRRDETTPGGPPAHPAARGAWARRLVAAATGDVTGGSAWDWSASKPLAGARVALVRETLGAGVDPAVAESIRNAASRLEALGCAVDDVSLSSLVHALPAYYVLACSEASSNLARYDGVRFGLSVRGDGTGTLEDMYRDTRRVGLGPEVRRRIIMGTHALSAGHRDALYERAQRVRRLVLNDFAAALGGADTGGRRSALLLPCAPDVAPLLGAYEAGKQKDATEADTLAVYQSDLMTVGVNLAGLPAVSVPAGAVVRPEGGLALPVGCQLVGSAFGEADLLGLAGLLERENGGWAGLAAAAMR